METLLSPSWRRAEMVDHRDDRDGVEIRRSDGAEIDGKRVPADGYREVMVWWKC